MKAAHQGVPVASLPNSQAGGGGLFSNLMQTASQVSAPSRRAIRASARPARADPVRRRLSSAADASLGAAESLGAPGSRRRDWTAG